MGCSMRSPFVEFYTQANTLSNVLWTEVATTDRRKDAVGAHPRVRPESDPAPVRHDPPSGRTHVCAPNRVCAHSRGKHVGAPLQMNFAAWPSDSKYIFR